jgi:hypothetical protein
MLGDAIRGLTPFLAALRRSEDAETCFGAGHFRSAGRMYRRLVTRRVSARALAELNNELQELRRHWDIGANYLNLGWFNDAVRSGDLADAEQQLQSMKRDAENGGVAYFTRKN